MSQWGACVYVLGRTQHLATFNNFMGLHRKYLNLFPPCQPSSASPTKLGRSHFTARMLSHSCGEPARCQFAHLLTKVMNPLFLPQEQIFLTEFP